MAEPATQYLVFAIGADEHAIAAAHLHEIVAYSPITRLPGMPAWIRGVVNLRGRVLPVIDLAVRFGRPEAAIGKRTCLVVVEVAIDGEPTMLGLLVDAVSRVLDIAPGDIAPPPAFGSQIRVEFLRGVVPVGNRFTVVLDLPRIFSAEEVLDISQRAQAAPVPAVPPEEQGVVFFDD